MCCKLRIIFIFLIICCTAVLAHAQNEIEAIKKQLSELHANDTEEKINLLNDLAWEYTYLDLDTAEIIANEALSLAVVHLDEFPNALSNSYGTLGIVYDIQGNNQKALTNYLKSLELKIELKDQAGIANMKNNIGALFFSQEDYAKALSFFKDALAVEIELADTMAQVGSLINIGVMEKNLGEIPKAKFYFKQALINSELKKEDTYLGPIYNNLGAVFLAEKSLDSSLYYFELAEHENLQKQNFYNYSITLENQARIYLLKNNLNSAKVKAYKALTLSRKNNFFVLTTNSYETLFEINLADNNLDSAYHYKDLFTVYRDSILAKENKQIVDEIEAKYELVKKEKALYLKDVEIAKNERESLIFKSILIGASLVLVFLIITVYLKVRNNKKLSEKNEIIERSLKEKEILMREIHHRVKNNIQAIKSIINIQKRKADSAQTKNSLEATLNRVNAMALIHNKLYQQNSLYEISSDQYFNELLKDVFLSAGVDPDNDRIKITLCNQVFKTDTLLTLGLVLNELVTNACKYGKSADNKLRLEVVSFLEDNKFILKVRDQGTATSDSEKGFGTDLIQAMIHKLKGKITYLSDNGFQTFIEIPIDKDA